VNRSDVRLQWDPDHDPFGRPLERRAIQLGLRGAALDAYGRKEVLEIIDMSSFIAQQRAALAAGGIGAIATPVEAVYRPEDTVIANRLSLDIS